MPRIGLVILFFIAGPAFAQFLSTEIPAEDDGAIAPPILRRLEKLERAIGDLEKAKHPPAPAEPPPTPVETVTRPTPTFAPFALTFSLPPQESRIATDKWQPAKVHETFTALGPTASKIYFSDRSDVVVGMSADFFSFSERRGTDQNGNPNIDRSNVAGLAPSLATRLHRRVIFNSQFLFENGGAESSNTVTLQKGQAIVLQAYIDWLGDEKKSSGLRIGHQLVPIGTVNTRHEGVSYFGVLKPELERELIPSTWHENGISLWVRRKQAEFQFGAFSSLNAQGLRGATFLAGGRSQGQNSASQDWMGVGRITVKGELAEAGASLAIGQTAQKILAYRHGTFGLGEIHIQARPTTRSELFLQFAQGFLSDADSVSIMNSTVMPERTRGASGHIALKIWRREEQNLWLYGRHSHYDLHDRVPGGFTRDDSLNKTQTTFGLRFEPLPNWVISTDYAFKKSSARDEDDELNFGTSISF